MADTPLGSKCTPSEEAAGLRLVLGTPRGKNDLATFGAYVLAFAALGFAAGYAVEKASDGK